MKYDVEKWYLEELKKIDRKARIEKIGLNKPFLSRKHKRNFSIISFIVYVFKKMVKEVK